LIVKELEQHKVAVLYQSLDSPVRDGAAKPKKPNGYKDSGADIAFALHQNKIKIITPVRNPDSCIDDDWVFADSLQGINQAIDLGASILWANTVLFDGHPIETVDLSTTIVIGQDRRLVDELDNKWTVRRQCAQASCPLPNACCVSDSGEEDMLSTAKLTPSLLKQQGLSFPLVSKPIRGRGSEAVSVNHDFKELMKNVSNMHSAKSPNGLLRYGSYTIIEEFLPGPEITITVMPPGLYSNSGIDVYYEEYWSLPPVKRENHESGIAPYNGTVAITQNSFVVDHPDPNMKKALAQCEDVGRIVGGSMPIRIDCRANSEHEYKIIDVNLKPNMTGPGRPGRDNQSSLTQLAAANFGWSYIDYLLSVMRLEI